MKQQQQQQVIFMMGLPGSGKSTVRKNMFPTLAVADCDEVKKMHPDYDPKHPEKLHAWSKVEHQKQLFRMFAGNESFVVDCTGTNIEKYLQWFNQAQSAGFEVLVVYVSVSLQTAIERNAKRERNVPIEVIIEKNESIENAFSFYSTIVKTEKIINE